MRGLFGDLPTMPLKDVVAYLGERRATGSLRIERQGVKKQVLIKDGEVINASSSEPREYLGQFLINLGHINEEQFNRAYETQKQTKVFLGKILIMIGALDEPTLNNVLNLKARETVLGAFQWTEGTFAFNPDAVLEVPDGLHLNIDLQEIHREGEFRETAWNAIRNAFPSGGVRLALDPSKLAEPPKPGSLDERLFELIAEERTVDEIILALHATDFFLYQRLYALYRLEAVQVAPDQPPPPPPPDEVDFELGPEQAVVGDEASSAELLSHAEAYLEQGALDDAQAIARKAHELVPTAASEELVRRVEAAIHERLHGAMIAQRQVPSLTVPPAKLRGLPLSAPERYLLSRIDGQRDVAAIVQASPLKEVQALRLLQRLIEQGLVALAPS